MNRLKWKNISFTNKNPAHYNCPKCEIGFLKLIKNTLNKKITPTGEQLNEMGYPHGIDYIFSGILECKNKECKEIVSISGSCLQYEIIPTPLEDGHVVPEFQSTYYPKFFYPNLRLIKLPENLPASVREQIDLSFSHYFNDLSSSANRIRNAIELILDELKAPKWFKTRAGNKHVFGNLHSRIDHFKKRNKTIGNLLMASKIIGNEGSHIGKVDIEDILDAYECLEEIIEYTYVKNRKRISELASKIVNTNKPLSKKSNSK